MRAGPVIAAAWRDTILFVVGLSLIVNEAVLRQGPERYGLLVLFAGMVGLPVIMRADERAVVPGQPSPTPPASPGPPAPNGGPA